MASLGAQVTGIDLAEKSLSVATLHGLESGIHVNYQLLDAEALVKTHAEQFDVVTCMEMLEHVPHPRSTVEACANLVKRGGHVFFSTLNRNPKSYLFAILGAEYILKLLPKGTHDYAKFIKPSELAQFARAAGLEVREYIGLTYNPLTQIYSNTPNISVNYAVHCVKP
jgi:2-polyprenyl-6-hydroxyphenyl methylase/3-demethylubiquinone-9 3-methyltransferase